MAGAYYRLQDLILVPGTPTNQRLEDAIDVLAYSTVTVQVRVPEFAAPGNLVIQHAAVFEESAFMDSGLVIATNATGSYSGTLENPLRFVRWRWDAATAVSFLIDVIARDN